MEIVRAGPADRETVAAILEDAGRWLQARGIDQWPAVTPRALLDWAAEQAARTGRDALRLDCLATNAVLCAYYEQAGLLARGRVGRGPWQCALYEKPVRSGG